MAETKTTKGRKKAEQVSEEVNENVQSENTSLDSTETVNVSHVEEVGSSEDLIGTLVESNSESSEEVQKTEEEDGEPDKEKVLDGQTEDLTGPAEENDNVNEESPVSEDKEAVSIEEAVSEFSETKEKIDNLDTDDEKSQEVIKEEIEKLDKLKEKLSEDIKKAETKLNEGGNNAKRRTFSTFGEFWNGVTETV